MDVLEIWRYPIKSIGGELLESVDVTSLGIQGDRRWGVMDVATGNILTARRTPKLLMATASLVGDLPVVATADGELIDGSLDEMSGSLSDWLGLRVELVAAGDAGGTFENPMDVENESDWMSWTGPAHVFHDSPDARVSLVSTATLENRDVRRFRINLVIGERGAGSESGEGGERGERGGQDARGGGRGGQDARGGGRGGQDARGGRGACEGADAGADVPLDVGVEDTFVGSRLELGSAVVLTVTAQIERCIMVTRPQPGLPADLEVLKRVIRERSNMLGIGSLVEAGGHLAVGDKVTVSGSSSS